MTLLHEPASPTIRRALAIGCAALAAALLLACTGVGDGGVSGTDEFLTRGADVVSDTLPSAPYVRLREASDDRDSFCVAVDALDALDVFSVAFTLTYDSRYARPTSFSTANGCLGLSGATLPAQVDWVLTPNEIVVGWTRDGSLNPTGVSCGRLIEICFDIVGTGSFTMGFTGNVALLRPDGTPVAGIDASRFFDATITTRH
jgi:hypothetical protein